MARVTTMPAYLHPLMEGCTVRLPRCAVCGARSPLNQHHVVKRSAGQLVRAGVIMPKPTITLCGMGNASGCHGLAHAGLLHFRWVSGDAVGGNFGNARRMECGDGGHWEYLCTGEPVGYLDALEMDGWVPLRHGSAPWGA